MKRIISLGVPSFITEVSSGLIILLFNFTILKISNNTGVAAYGIIANLALIVISIFTGIAQGIQPIISKSYGEGKIKNIRTIFKYGIITAIILGVGCYLFGLIFSEEIVNLFNSEGDKVLLSMAIGGINIYFSAFIFMGINIVTTSFFASINKPKESFAISMIRGLIIVIPLILLLPNFLGMTGVWLTIPLSEAITLFISIIIYFKYKREIVNS